MKRFIRIKNGVMTEHYITSICNGLVYYGYYKQGHENKVPTAVMTLTYFETLKDKTYPEILI